MISFKNGIIVIHTLKKYDTGGKMNTKLSKLMKKAILFNVILTLIIMCFHGYTIHRIYESNEQIVSVMEERGVIRETAIYMLQKEGVDLEVHFNSAMFSMSICIVALIATYSYTKSNSFFTGFFAAFIMVFSNYIGGMLLFYVFLTGKGEEKKDVSNQARSTKWQSYIHKKALIN